ncbi:hypothetical protein CYMTET_46792, partial [Cymbomonas tetramitiformis]
SYVSDDADTSMRESLYQARIEQEAAQSSCEEAAAGLSEAQAKVKGLAAEIEEHAQSHAAAVNALDKKAPGFLKAKLQSEHEFRKRARRLEPKLAEAKKLVTAQDAVKTLEGEHALIQERRLQEALSRQQDGMSSGRHVIGSAPCLQKALSRQQDGMSSGDEEDAYDVASSLLRDPNLNSTALLNEMARLQEQLEGKQDLELAAQAARVTLQLQKAELKRDEVQELKRVLLMKYAQPAPNPKDEDTDDEGSDGKCDEEDLNDLEPDVGKIQAELRMRRVREIELKRRLCIAHADKEELKANLAEEKHEHTLAASLIGKMETEIGALSAQLMQTDSRGSFSPLRSPAAQEQSDQGTLSVLKVASQKLTEENHELKLKLEALQIPGGGQVFTDLEAEVEELRARLVLMSVQVAESEAEKDQLRKIHNTFSLPAFSEISQFRPEVSFRARCLDPTMVNAPGGLQVWVLVNKEGLRLFARGLNQFFPMDHIQRFNVDGDYFLFQCSKTDGTKGVENHSLYASEVVAGCIKAAMRVAMDSKLNTTPPPDTIRALMAREQALKSAHSPDALLPPSPSSSPRTSPRTSPTHPASA